MVPTGPPNSKWGVFFFCAEAEEVEVEEDEGVVFFSIVDAADLAGEESRVERRTGGISERSTDHARSFFASGSEHTLLADALRWRGEK